ncbi:MAG: DUF962 domain-containing protein, partial [Pseudomonadota bacterium]
AHYVGTGLGFVAIAAAVLLSNPWFLLLVPVAGYGCAWVSHAFLERNKPATFTYPLWSLMGDYLMFFLAMSGRLRPHLAAAGISSAEPSPPSQPSPSR